MSPFNIICHLSSRITNDVILYNRKEIGRVNTEYENAGNSRGKCVLKLKMSRVIVDVDVPFLTFIII